MSSIKSSNVAIVGAGYVGLCTAAGLASLGHRVTCYDILPEKIDGLNANVIPIFEEGLDERISQSVFEGNLKFHHDLDLAVANADFIFLCVPTPQNADGAADLTFVLNAAESVGLFAKAGATLVTKSTVPVGAAHRIAQALSRTDLHVASNPEFLREGTAMKDFYNPDRIVVGSDEISVSRRVAELYQLPDVPMVLTSPASAELIKYAANSFLAMKLSFVNELAAISELTGANIHDVTAGFGLDKRIGSMFMTAGPGWGGSCFPKDVRALLSISESIGAPSTLLEAALQSNEATFRRVVERVDRIVGPGLEGSSIGVLGLSFKAGTDDVRDSPALAIIERLIDRGASVKAFDPKARLGSSSSRVIQVGSVAEVFSGADLVLVLTEWPEFSEITPELLLPLMRRQNVFDTRGILTDAWRTKSHRFERIGSL